MGNRSIIRLVRHQLTSLSQLLTEYEYRKRYQEFLGSPRCHVGHIAHSHRGGAECHLNFCVYASYPIAWVLDVLILLLPTRRVSYFSARIFWEVSRWFIFLFMAAKSAFNGWSTPDISLLTSSSSSSFHSIRKSLNFKLISRWLRQSESNLRVIWRYFLGKSKNVTSLTDSQTVLQKSEGPAFFPFQQLLLELKKPSYTRNMNIRKCCCLQTDTYNQVNKQFTAQILLVWFC